MITKFKIFEGYKESDIDNILKKIDDFLNSPQRNIWVQNKAIKIYIRKSKRNFRGKMFDFFDFATIEVQKQGQGLFTQVLKRFEEIYPDKNIFIESVMTERFADYIKNNLGFEEEENNVNRNFYKMKQLI
jgi:hypothetical protein